MTALSPAGDAIEIRVGLVGVGVVGSAVLDFFAGKPMELPIPGARFGGPSVARVRIWSAARRSRRNPKAVPPEFIESLVTRDERGCPRFFYDIDPDKPGAPRSAGGPAWRQIVRDPNVDIVVELTGSALAEALIEEALWNGKCVVTANKAVLSRSGYELARLAQLRGVVLACEASVGGGMPIVQTMAGSVGGRVTAVLAIINGTTNFILSEMRAALRKSEAGAAYPAAVCAAIHRGLAEADPGADVLGEDARSKIIILAGLAFGVRLRPRDVYTRGIARRGSTRGPSEQERPAFHSCPDSQRRPCPEVCGRDDHISTQPVFHEPDLRVLERLGYVPKLLAGAQVVPGHGSEAERVVAWVQPSAIPAQHPLAGVEGSENACLLEVESPVDGGGASSAKRYAITLRGPGAGGPETASSVMADIQFCARQLAVTRPGADDGRGRGPLYMYGAGAFSRAQAFGGTPALCQTDGLAAPFFLRFIVGGSVTAQRVAQTLAQHGVQVGAIRGERAPAHYLYFRTQPTPLHRIETGVEAVLRDHGPARVSLDVLYLPILEGPRWQERPGA